MFQTELDFFIKNQEGLVNKYQDKVLVIIGEEIVGVYDDELQAYFNAQKQYPLGTFMIQACVPGPEAYTVTITPIELLHS